MENRGCGIICEYNPFHKGHAYQLSKAKEICEFTVCAMSGDFVQRGEEAFQDKKVRAKNAMTNGADIVLEIPFPYRMSNSATLKGGATLFFTTLQRTRLP